MYQLTPTGVKRLDDGAQIPSDTANADWRAYLAWLALGNHPQPANPPDVFTLAVAAVQQRLDAFAQTRGYDGILSACTYTASAVPKFAAEGAYCVQSRDGHWSACYQMLADVQAGRRATPTLDEVIAAMPVLVWPAA